MDRSHYDRCIANGCSPRLAEMLAAGQPPMSNTDREFLEGHCNGNQFAGREAVGDAYAAVARAEGADTTGKVYMGSLAAYPGDPRAWVSGRGDVQRVLDERGWGAEGAVTRKVARVAEPGRVGIAPDIVAREVGRELEKVPAADRPGVNVADLTEQVTRKLKPHWAD